MYLSKLVIVLKSLDESGMKRLKDYVHSSYFKVPYHSVTLFDCLFPIHPYFSSKKLNCKAIGIMSQNLSTPSKQARAATQLLEAVEHFITLEDWQRNDRSRAWHHLRAFQELQLYPQLKKGHQRRMQELNNYPEQDFETFFERHLLTELSLNGFNAMLNRTLQNDIKPVIQTLDEFYALKKLRYLCEAINRRQFFGADIIYDEKHIANLIQILQPYNRETYLYVYLTVNVFRMLAADSYEDSELYYLLIKQYASKVTSNPLPPAVIESATYAVNHCLLWFNKGDEKAGNEYLWWIDWKRDHNLLLEKNKLMPITFRNIIVIAVVNRKKPAWIDCMIKTCALYLPAEHLDTNVAFARGLYHYALKNYREAIRSFLIAQAKDGVIFNALIRRWQWICLYECDPNDTDALYNHLLSFEKCIQRNKKELQHLQKVFALFIKYSFKLIKLADRASLIQNLNDLQSEDFFAGKHWLTEQFSLRNKKSVPLMARKVDLHGIING